jgi:hypothetical protein
MLLSSIQLTAMSQHHAKNMCSLHLASIFAAFSKKAPGEIPLTALIVPWSNGHSNDVFAEKAQLGHFANFLNLWVCEALINKKEYSPLH